MDWFKKSVRRELEKRGFKVEEQISSLFAFISENKHGKRAGVYCKPHGHIYKQERLRLLSRCCRTGLDTVYIASEAYSDTTTHAVKLTELK